MFQQVVYGVILGFKMLIYPLLNITVPELKLTFRNIVSNDDGMKLYLCLDIEPKT
jgi:hypothetical protein